MLTDAGGVPLVVQTVPANQHDVTTMLPLVVNMPAVAGSAVPKHKPKTVVADKAFDCEDCGMLRWLGIQPCCPVAARTNMGLA